MDPLQFAFAAADGVEGGVHVLEEDAAFPCELDAAGIPVEEPDAETLGVAVHRHYVVEIDDGIKPEFFYKTQNGYVLLGLFDAATARKNVKEDTD